MNQRLTDVEKIALLEVIYRGFLAIRIAGWAGDAEKAAAIADALHNVPHLLSGRHPDWTMEVFREHFLAGLIEKYPDLRLALTDSS